MKIVHGFVWALLVSGIALFSFSLAHAERRDLTQITRMSPFNDCFEDNPDDLTLGQVFRNSEVEPWVAVNPRDEDHIVVSWQQDRWSTGGARGLVAGVSFDGGKNWLEVTIPGLTLCSEDHFFGHPIPGSRFLQTETSTTWLWSWTNR